MAPPRVSLRSSTHTRHPPRASSAPHASELIPLPTMTASYSGTRQFPELVIGDEAALPRAKLLHACEQIGSPVLRHVEPELLGLDADGVEPALLAEHDPALGGNELRRV